MPMMITFDDGLGEDEDEPYSGEATSATVDAFLADAPRMERGAVLTWLYKQSEEGGGLLTREAVRDWLVALGGTARTADQKHMVAKTIRNVVRDQEAALMFATAMDDDLSVPQALGVLHETVRKAYAMF